MKYLLLFFVAPAVVLACMIYATLVFLRQYEDAHGLPDGTPAADPFPWEDTQ